MKIFILLVYIILITNISFGNSSIETEFIEEINYKLSREIKNSELALSKSYNKDILKLSFQIIKNHKNEIKKLQKIKSKFYTDKNNLHDKIKVINESDFQTQVGIDNYYLDSLYQYHKDIILIIGKALPELKNEKLHHLAIVIAKRNGNEMSKIEKIKKKLLLI